MSSKERRKQPIKRPTRRVDCSPQGLLFELPLPTAPEPDESAKRFVEGDPYRLVLARIDEYLRQTPYKYVLDLREFLQGLDWTEFTARYSGKGRQPYAPWLMVGLVLYGVMRGVTSLRGLERLAQIDLGAMWLTGGCCPDHTVLCRFLLRHDDTLTAPFFEQLTGEVLSRTGSSSHTVAGDGTVIEAMASRFQELQIEAAEQEALVARKRADAAPDDKKLVARAEQAERVARAAQERAEARRRTGAKRETTTVNRTDPDAATLKDKRGFFAPAYVVSALANSDRIVIGQAVDPTSEIAPVGALIDQAQRITNGETERLLLDGNYHRIPVLQAALERHVDVLCPAQGQSRRSKPPKFFPKSQFLYDEDRDVYICPAKHELTKRSRGRDRRRKQSYSNYRTDAANCSRCPLRSRCTTSKRGRLVRRYDHEWTREAVRDNMTKASAKRVFRKRQAMVEPVFGEQRHIQNLRRFRRRGLSGVRLEWALHCTAHNLRRWLARRSAGPAFVRLIAVIVAWFAPSRTAPKDTADHGPSFHNRLSATRESRVPDWALARVRR